MRRPIKKRAEAEPDAKYSSPLVVRLINQVMKKGKKSIAQKIVYSAMEKLERQSKKPALEALVEALDNAGPQVELRSRRVGGANYQVPHEVRGDRKVTLALRWILIAARSQKGKPMDERLAEELNNAINNTGLAIKKKLDTHKMADANKAFAHFSW